MYSNTIGFGGKLLIFYKKCGTTYGGVVPLTIMKASLSLGGLLKLHLEALLVRMNDVRMCQDQIDGHDG
jgi:hypothetical protein